MLVVFGYPFVIAALSASFAWGAPAPAPWPPKTGATWPDTPFTVSGRDIISASGAKVVYAGVNWPGAADTMLPEGLQYASIDSIASFISKLGMNVVRLTYAIEMIDDHFANSPHQSLRNTLVKALGSKAGNTVLSQILANNPQFNVSSTRLDVFDAVAAGLAQYQIYVHLDNHVSKAQWCCNNNDGNAWFGDTYFSVQKWHRGLGFMAAHAASWQGFASMSLRNELRQPDSDSPASPYTWNTWIKNALPAASVIHKHNPSPLIFFSGEGYNTDDTYAIQRQTWNHKTFTPEKYAFRNKVVYEIHNYQTKAKSCSNDIQPRLYHTAYCAMNLSDSSCPNHGPVIMTEFGFDQTDSSDQSVYAQCISSTLLQQPGGPGGWMQWVLAGSYYIRSGIKDYDETWGLLNHDWSDFRNRSVIDDYLRPFVAATLKPTVAKNSSNDFG
ncbi:glycoside hydrolase family 5 protein [Baudoinia panamericana UAMH 10762]|uniref:Glycoside hydrolase family 5 protein n=1 Tax=Baudoinia panamericana (strain UAMH 10762) TaxID=717646 RepID=M2N472_BAUPA|nr:glycoside hydrolase family 5 protein [Baudoinia panamericana UAMH 10762]EMC98788.1 glycoside hydrolase family 5 protein [Baudoinia panamericana UAMH 10762]